MKVPYAKQHWEIGEEDPETGVRWDSTITFTLVIIFTLLFFILGGIASEMTRDIYLWGKYQITGRKQEELNFWDNLIVFTTLLTIFILVVRVWIRKPVHAFF